jgi:hypothetical protein
VGRDDEVNKGEGMDAKDVIKSQYRASLKMLNEAIESCPDDLWNSPDDKNPFWHVAYHAIVYARLYLHPSLEGFEDWEKHREGYHFLGEPEAGAGPRVPYSKEEVLEYHSLLLEELDGLVDDLDLEAESGFYWLPLNKLELQFYNIRHVMLHTGELCERLGARAGVEVGWVGRVHPE